MSLAVLACRWWTTARIEGACGWAGCTGMHVHFPAACTSACVLPNFWFLCVSQLLHVCRYALCLQIVLLQLQRSICNG